MEPKAEVAERSKREGKVEKRSVALNLDRAARVGAEQAAPETSVRKTKAAAEPPVTLAEALAARVPATAVRAAQGPATSRLEQKAGHTPLTQASPKRS